MEGGNNPPNTKQIGVHWAVLDRFEHIRRQNRVWHAAGKKTHRSHRKPVGWEPSVCLQSVGAEPADPAGARLWFLAGELVVNNFGWSFLPVLTCFEIREMSEPTFLPVLTCFEIREVSGLAEQSVLTHIVF